MANEQLLSNVADHLSDCCPTRDELLTAVSVVIPRQDIPECDTPRDSWHFVLLRLQDAPEAIHKIIDAMIRRWPDSESLQKAKHAMGGFHSGEELRLSGVQISKQHWLFPLGLNEHFRKAEVYLGRTMAAGPLAETLLALGPALAAQESDLHLAEKLESLGKLLSEETFKALLATASHPIPEVRCINDLVREQIDDLRQTASDSVELKDLAPSEMQGESDPIGIVLECKLKHVNAAMATLKTFMEGVRTFEKESLKFNDSGEEGKRLVEMITAVCSAAQRLVDPLRKSLRSRLALATEAIPKFLRNEEGAVSSLLMNLHPGQRVGTPAPTLWEKILVA